MEDSIKPKSIEALRGEEAIGSVPSCTDVILMSPPDVVGRLGAGPGRFLEPAEVARLWAFLPPPEGGSIIGQLLVVYGGASL